MPLSAKTAKEQKGDYDSFPLHENNFEDGSIVKADRSRANDMTIHYNRESGSCELTI
jgi:hypothetical protein